MIHRLMPDVVRNEVYTNTQRMYFVLRDMDVVLRLLL